MPTTRKSSRLSSGGKQSTLSFNHKVTKSVPKSAKDAVHKSSSLSKELPVTGIKKREVEEEEEEDVKPPLVHSEDEAEEKQDVVAPTPTHAPAEKTDAELRAARISDASIERYWRKIEDSRMAKAVHKKHTEGLSTGEKVLRYFDVSSQYGVSFFLLFFCLFLSGPPRNDT